MNRARFYAVISHTSAVDSHAPTGQIPYLWPWYSRASQSLGGEARPALWLEASRQQEWEGKLGHRNWAVLMLFSKWENPSGAIFQV